MFVIVEMSDHQNVAGDKPFRSFEFISRRWDVLATVIVLIVEG